MPVQIVTASIALLFAAVLVLSSQRFVDARATDLSPSVSARAVR
jgi:hypothetical protein